MIHRRTLLTGLASTVLGALFTGCQPNPGNALKIMLLEGAVPAEVLKKFHQQSDQPVSFEMVAQLKTVFQRLQGWQLSPSLADASSHRLFARTGAETRPKPSNLVSLGDYWLPGAIAQKLLDPLDIPSESLAQLPVVWQQFVSRDRAGFPINLGSRAPAETLLWAAPYKVQSLVIVYRQSKFPQASAHQPPFRTWRDLLQPQLSQRLVLPEHPRVVLGIVQKMESGSFNLSFAPSLTAEQLVNQLTLQLAVPFAQLNQQVRAYDSQNSLKALINEDVDAVVGWSGDVTGALDRYRDLKVVVPAEGSLLSADMWVRPKGAEMSAAAQAWIDFCWQSGPATQISLSGRGVSPVFLGEEAGDRALPTALNNSGLPIATIKNSEPLLPLPATARAAYWELWQTLRAS